jgi:hypothetical protein
VPRPELALKDFELLEEIRRLMARLDDIKDGTIERIEVRAGIRDKKPVQPAHIRNAPPSTTSTILRTGDIEDFDGRRILERSKEKGSLAGGIGMRIFLSGCDRAPRRI